MKNYKNVGELLKALNDIVTCPEFLRQLRKVHGHSEFHDLVMEYAKTVIPSEVQLGTWQVFFPSLPSLPFSQKFISYNRTFIPYKNSPRQDKGNFSDVVFALESGIWPGLTLKGVKNRLRASYIRNCIIELKASIKQREQDIELNKKHISELESELSKIIPE